jgi:hypothetical protein
MKVPKATAVLENILRFKATNPYPTFSTEVSD